MAVYTEVDRAELEDFLQVYTLGHLLNYVGIADGIENSNYQLTTSKGDFVLTLFEDFSVLQLGYFLSVLQHLHGNGVPCPQPQPDMNGCILHILLGKPAAVFKRIPGASIYHPKVWHCEQVGTQLANLQQCGESFPTYRANSMDLRWCMQTAEKIKPRLNSVDYQKIIAELEFQAIYRQVQLPQGLIHGDLFKDNVLFTNEKLSGVLDFYNACYDSWLLDLAITANDWCHEPDGEINSEKLNAFLDSYQQHRCLTAIERELLPVMLRAGALRFWLSRLEHQLFPRAGQLTQEKDPSLYQSILAQHQAQNIAKL